MQLNQYYTAKTFGDALINNLSSISPESALDLGFGSGSLLHAAKRRWEEIYLFGADIDKQNVTKASKEINALELNGLNPDAPLILKERFGNIDLLISNPPYFTTDLDFNCREILKSVGLLDCISSSTKKIPAELIFLAQNLRLLAENGEIGIILPAGLISGKRWKPIRQFIFQQYAVSNVIQMPVNSFKKTDAQTFILILKNKSVPNSEVKISHLEHNSEFFISIHSAIERADFSFFLEASERNSSSHITKSDFKIFRGNMSHNALSLNKAKHIHTTDMAEEPSRIRLEVNPLLKSKNVEAGDILIARVGRRCLGRVMMIESGCMPLSDCVIAIRASSQQTRNEIWKKLTLPECRSYFNNACFGVGAKYITHQLITDYLNSEYDETTSQLRKF